MLVTNAAQSWQRLQRAREAEDRYFKDRDVLDAILNHSREFKAVTRYVAECDRSWRQSLAALERVKRERKRDLSSPNMRRNPVPISSPELPVPSSPPSVPPTTNASEAAQQQAEGKQFFENRNALVAPQPRLKPL